MSRSGIRAAILALVAGSAVADPIDDFLRSPGPTGDALMAARMFAWCSARYELAAWLARPLQPHGERRSGRLEDQALGARAAGAYRLHADWSGRGDAQAGGPGAAELDFAHYLSVVEGMAVQDGGEITRRLAEVPEPSEEFMAVLAEIDAEWRRCEAETVRLQQIQVGKMTREQIALAKARPKMLSRPGPPRLPAP